MPSLCRGSASGAAVSARAPVSTLSRVTTYGLSSAEAARRLEQRARRKRRREPHLPVDRPPQRPHSLQPHPRVLRRRADRDRSARRPALRGVSSSTRASASSRRSAPSGRSIASRCSRLLARASCATRPSRRSSSATSWSAMRSRCARAISRGRRDGCSSRPRTPGRRVDPDRRVRPRRTARGRPGPVGLVLRRRQRDYEAERVGADRTPTSSRESRARIARALAAAAHHQQAAAPA